MAQGSAKSRTENSINIITGIRDAGSRAGLAALNKARDVLNELRESGSLPDSIYNYRGMTAQERRDWASSVSGRKLSSKVHVHITRDKKLDRTTNAGGIRRTLEGFKVSYSYS